MKILFISLGDGPDYQSDVVFYGLNEIPELDIYTTSDMWYNIETQIFEVGDGIAISRII